MRIHGATITTVALALVLLASSGTAASDTAPAADRGAWRQLGTLDIARSGHTATLLPDETILVVGGENTRGKPVLVAELVYPATGATRAAGTLPWGLKGHQAVALPDGRVLFSGSDVLDHRSFSTGQDNCAPYPPLTWDPATLAITPITGIADSNGASATLLDDGRVLFAGGGSDCNQNGGSIGLDAVTIWDPASGEVSETVPLTQARGFHPAIRLEDGRVVVGGGGILGFAPARGGHGPVGTLELRDPVTGEWELARFPGVVPADLVVLDDGLVVMSGTVTDGVGAGLQVLDAGRQPMALLQGDMPVARLDAALTAQDGDTVAIIGGFSDERRPLPTAVLWSPGSGERSRIKYPKAGADSGHTATTMSDGSIIVIGGRDAHAGGRVIDSVESLTLTQ